LAIGASGTLSPAGARLACKIVLEQQRPVSESPRVVAFHKQGNLVAEAVKAARLEPEHRNATIDVGRECSNGALGLVPCLVDAPDREKRAPTTQRPRAAERSGTCTRHPAALSTSIAAAMFLRLEIAIEGVDE